MSATAPHWTEAYYGSLYLDSVADLLTPHLTALEAEAIASLAGLRPGDRVLDLACGHGRHALELARRGARVFGLDRSADYLRRATSVEAVGDGTAPRFVRGDMRALPFLPESFDAAFSWYSSLFVFDDPTNERCLAEMARVVRRGGKVLVEHANPLRLGAEPEASAERVLPDGSRVAEESRWDAARGIDRCHRRLVRSGGELLEATAELRYFSPAEWSALADRVGLRLVALTSTAGATCSPPAELSLESPDLVALLTKSG